MKFAELTEDEGFVMGFRADIAVGAFIAAIVTAFLATGELIPTLIMGTVASVILFLMFIQHWFFSLHEERPQPERRRLILLQFVFGMLLIWVPTILIVLFARAYFDVLRDREGRGETLGFIEGLYRFYVGPYDDPDGVLFWHFIYFPILYLLTFCFPLSVTIRLCTHVADELADPSWFRPVASVFVVTGVLAVVGACYYAPYYVVHHAYGGFLALLFVSFVTVGVLGQFGRST